MQPGERSQWPLAHACANVFSLPPLSTCTQDKQLSKTDWIPPCAPVEGSSSAILVNLLLPSDYQLCRTKVPSYGVCPLPRTKASSCRAQRMLGTMVTPRCVYKMCGTKASHAAQEPREIFHTCLLTGISLRGKVPSLKLSPKILDLRLASLSDGLSLNRLGFYKN